MIAPVEQLPPMRIIWLDRTPSTHQLLKLDPEYARLDPYTMVVARRQTAGRGQRGNSWESEDYKNLTFSMAVYPGWLQPAAQFSLSEGMALAVVALLAQHGIKATVKWPNDIYVGNDKICGILIDHSLTGNTISRTVVSAGINVNQLRFLSDAPNPVSMLGLMPEGTPEFEIEPLAVQIQHYIRTAIETTRTAVGRQQLHTAFMENLYRNDGMPHRYFDNVTDEPIEAIIREIGPTGLLTLELTEPQPCTRTYAFKEITFIQ